MPSNNKVIKGELFESADVTNGGSGSPFTVPKPAVAKDIKVNKKNTKVTKIVWYVTSQICGR